MSSSPLTATVTVRLPDRIASRLRARAKEEDLPPSEIVRRALERELEILDVERGPTAYERSARFVGVLDTRRVPAGRTARDEAEGWEPDRRG